MRTFKEHQVGGKTFEQATQESLISGSKSYKSILNIYIQSLNIRPDRHNGVLTRKTLYDALNYV